jgi:glucosyl-3-phosphoglycerate synthase
VGGALIRTFHHQDFAVEQLVAAKGDRVASVCLPARDEARTVGTIVAAIVDELVPCGLVDEVLVVDDHSTDRTSAVAANAGARVVRAQEVLPEEGAAPGKGAALWKSVFASRGDLIAWCDADILGFDTRFVVGLLGPLLLRSDVAFVKGFYDRPAHGPAGGGRVTELVARPVISLLFPHLAPIVQPLAGEYAGRREVLEALPFVSGYGVDLGLLIDVADRYGVDSIAQVDLGTRVHRNRSLEELGPQATAVLRVALDRAGLRVEDLPILVRPGLEPVAVEAEEHPPLVETQAYRRRSA